jgi:acyl-CoA synthetase (AMP-forming)/AMP-acid ligase II
MISYTGSVFFMNSSLVASAFLVIPCSVYPPNPDQAKAKFSFEQFNNQVADAGAKFALTTASFKLLLQFKSIISSIFSTKVKWLATDKLGKPVNVSVGEVPVPEDIAFIQYSSGSTDVPKGVMISHGAVIFNIYATMRSYLKNDNAPNLPSLGVTWLPQYHDLSLVGFVLQSVLSHAHPCVLCSPIDFICNPLLWAEMIEKFQATFIAGPNFSYSLLAKRMMTKHRVLKDCKLHRASIAAEPIDPDTIERMIGFGIPRGAIVPAYGECYVAS